MNGGRLGEHAPVVVVAAIRIVPLAAGVGIGTLLVPRPGPAGGHGRGSLATCSSTTSALGRLGVTCRNVSSTFASASAPDPSSSRSDAVLVCPTAGTCGNSSNASMSTFDADAIAAGDPVDALTLQWRGSCARLGEAGGTGSCLCTGAPAGTTFEVVLTVNSEGTDRDVSADVATPLASAGGWVSKSDLGAVSAEVQFLYDLGLAHSAVLVSYAVLECSPSTCA